MAGVGRWSGSRPVDTRGRQQLPWEPCGVVRPLPVAPRVPPKCHASSAREGFHTGRGLALQFPPRWARGSGPGLLLSRERLRGCRLCVCALQALKRDGGLGGASGLQCWRGPQGLLSEPLSATHRSRGQGFWTGIWPLSSTDVVLQLPTLRNQVLAARQHVGL